MTSFEVNFDSIVGPTHNYAGLAYGNLASLSHARSISHPKAAALEGLAKMKLLMDLGVKQAVLPPQVRPDLAALRRLGITGSDSQVIQNAAQIDPVLLAACSSASAMWAANAATVSASADTSDGRVHFTPANLISQFHRSLEAPSTARILATVFHETRYFEHHAPLPGAAQFGDEGAANHTRLAVRHDRPGLNLFVYGREALGAAAEHPGHFPARQTREASVAIARLHGLAPQSTLFLQQNPTAIDAGVFHNDVICVGHRNVLLCHERAFLDTARLIALVQEHFARHCGGELLCFVASEQELPLREAVKSYLFNSQIVSLPDDTMALIAPLECRESPASQQFVDRVVRSGGPIHAVHYVDIRQSMRNGGGPACLRLRVPLTQTELSAVHPGVFLTPDLYQRLCQWVERHYRDELAPEDLADPQLHSEAISAQIELSALLQLPLGFGSTPRQ